MTQKAVSFNELMDGVLDQLRINGYMESTLTIYRRTYSRIRVFINRFDTDFYTPEIGAKFLADTKVKKSTASAYACAIRRLNDFIESKPFRSHHDCPHVQAPPEFTSILEEFLQECIDSGNKPATLQFKERTCGLFLDSLKKGGCTDLSCLDVGRVSRSLLTFSNKERYAVIRQFLRFLADKSITETDLSGIVPHYRRRKNLPTTYTPEEIARVESAVDTSTDCFLQVFFGKSCRHFWRMLHLRFGESCNPMEWQVPPHGSRHSLLKATDMITTPVQREWDYPCYRSGIPAIHSKALPGL